MAIKDTLPNGFYRPQIDAAVRIWTNRRHLLADQPGAGKTLQALLAAELEGLFERRANILILSTMTACQLTWSQEIRKRVASQYEVITADLTDAGGKASLPPLIERSRLLTQSALEASVTGLPLIVISNFETARWKYSAMPVMPSMFDAEWDMVIIDESHLVLPTRKDAPKDLTDFLYGLYNLRYAPGCIRLAMSGTPDRGKLENRYGTWKWLHPEHGYTDYWKWVRNNFKVSTSNWGGLVVGSIKDVPAWNQYSHRHMTRRTKNEMFEGLPEKLWAGDGGIDLPLTDSQRRAYDSYQADVEDLYLSLSSSPDPVDQHKAAGLKLSFNTRARQMGVCSWKFPPVGSPPGMEATPIVQGPAGSSKLAWILDWLGTRGHLPGRDWNADGGKVVIVSYFVEVLRWLQAELHAAGYKNVPILSGATTQRDKLVIEESFQRGDQRIILLSGHLGVSINLDAADDMIFTDVVHDPDKMEQAEDRIHRASRMHQVVYWRLIAEDTADMAILSDMDARYRSTRSTYEGSRGVEFARAFLGAKTKEDVL